MAQLNYRFTPDTDVFVLALRHYPELCDNTLFVTGRGQHHRIIELNTIIIVQTLGPEKISSLPAFHALSGAVNTGSFSGKGKLLCWKKQIHQLSLALQNLDKLLIKMKKLSQPLRSLSVCHINQEQNV